MKMLADVGSEGFWTKRANLGGWDAWEGTKVVPWVCVWLPDGVERGRLGEGYPPKTAPFVQGR